MKRAALAAIVAVRALACTVVEGDRIRGADMALTGLDTAADLGPAPLAGARRVFRAPELARLAIRHGFAAPAGLEVCFERAAQRLTLEKLEPVLLAALGMDRVEIVDFSRYPVPQGTLEFPRAALASSGFWRGRVVYGENRSASVWAKIRVGGSQAGSVERGDKIVVEVRSGGVLLAFEAAAESSGHAGEPVIVKNPANGRRFRARVEGPGKVSIQK